MLPTMREHSSYMDVLFERLGHPEKGTSVSLEVRLKDLRLARSLAMANRLETPVAELVEGLFEQTMDKHGEKADQTQCMRLLIKDCVDPA